MKEFGYSVKDLVENGPWGVTTIYKLMGTGQLKAKKAGGKTLITPESVRECIANLPDYPTWEEKKALVG